jgi:hypothetical protein
MPFEQRDMSGALFARRRKETDSPKAPGYKGDAKIDGVDYKIAAWVRDGKNGKFFSLKFERADAPQEKTPRPAPIEQAGFDDEIPF